MTKRDRSGLIDVPGAPFTPEEINAAAEERYREFGLGPRQELTVLPADPPRKTLGFTIREFLGHEIYFREGFDPEDRQPITTKDGLKVGDEILVKALVPGYHIMTVEADKYGELSARSEEMMAVLKFGEDGRESWTCIGLVNLRGLKKLELKTEGNQL